MIRRRAVPGILIALPLLIAACGDAPSPSPPSAANVSAVLGGEARETAGFARVTGPREFVFPADHGPHPDYQHEWWYFTGNLRTDAGRHFGYQFTVFRIGLAPGEPQRDSAWAFHHLYMAHFALTDTASRRFHAFERFARGALGLAGAQAQPFRIWLEDWQATGGDAAMWPVTIHAAADDIALDLALQQGGPVVLQGEHGYSQKSSAPGNASHYYSLTRLPTTGTITIDGGVHSVQGTSWLDREWSTSALGADQAGWDWFALQLGDGSDLMFYRLRNKDGSAGAFSAGTLVGPDGAVTLLRADDVIIDELQHWRSARTGARYPSRWRLRVPAHALSLDIAPVHADQELDLTVRYWEGAVTVTGQRAGSAVNGVGYVELVGYTDG